MSLSRSTAWPLAWTAAALIVYATLYPWAGWHWPDRHLFSWVLPKLPQEFTDDLIGNLLGYLPFGAMLCLAHLRSGREAAWAAALALVTGSVMSYCLELIQFTVPGRVPSITDWMLNTLGMAWGALAAVTANALGLVDQWNRLREKWFIPQAGWGLALLWVWPLGLLFPPPLPLGEGQLLPHVRMALVDLTQDTALPRWLLPDDPLTLWSAVRAMVIGSDWVDAVEALTVAAGLLAPMCLVCAVARPWPLRLILLTAVVLAGVGVTTLSTALNFGAAHALSWISLSGLTGLLMGAVAGSALINRTRTTSAWVGVFTLLMLVGLIHLAPSGPYFAQTLQAWERGRFIRFHGLSRWLGILWPYVALGWLLARALGKDSARQPDWAQVPKITR